MCIKHICYMQENWRGVQLCGVNLRLYKVKELHEKTHHSENEERNAIIKKVKNLFARLKWTSVNLILQFFLQTCLFTEQQKSLRTYKKSLETGHFHLKFNSEKNSAFHSFFKGYVQQGFYTIAMLWIILMIGSHL